MAKVQKTDRQDEPVPDAERPGMAGWLYEEAVDHLFPWSARFSRQKIGFKAAGIGLAVVVTATWILAAAGRVGPAALIGWWSGWSVYEIIVRRHCKPWVKEGPWWGRKHRPANTMDLVAYVVTKNLLFGAGRVLILKALGQLS
ncbi:MAG: hypothetical protein ACYC42_05205 [Lysobacter sp.]